MLEPAIDTGGPMGRMVLIVLGMVVEMELGFLRDRQRAGRAFTRVARPLSTAHASCRCARKRWALSKLPRRCKGENVYKALKAAGVN